MPRAVEGSETIEPGIGDIELGMPDFAIASILVSVLATMTTSMPVSLVNGS